MSKLQIVKQALESNPNVVIVNVDEQNYLPDRNGYFSHTLDYWVAPRRALYTAPELQTFMTGLIPNLVSTQMDSFHQYDKESDLSFGVLYFDEKIGEERTITRRVITLDEKDLLRTMERYTPKSDETVTRDVLSGKQTIEKDVREDYLRRTWVRLFPSQEIARDILSEKLDSEFSISPKNLRKYQPSPLQRLVNRISVPSR